MLPAWERLIKRAGGVGALADEFQTSRRTILRWSRGETVPTDLEKRAIDAWASLHGIAPMYGESTLGGERLR